MTRHQTLTILALFMIAFFSIIHFREPSDVRECLRLVEDIDDEAIQLAARRRGYESFGPLNELIANRARELDDRVAGAVWAYAEALQEAEAAFTRHDHKAFASGPPCASLLPQTS
jgi:hypothetical protein